MVNNRFAPPLGNPVFTTGLVTNQSLPSASEVFTPVCDSVHGGGAAWQGVCGGGVHGRGVSIAKDVHGRGACMRQRLPLKRTVYILLESIFVNNFVLA